MEIPKLSLHSNLEVQVLIMLMEVATVELRQTKGEHRATRNKRSRSGSGVWNPPLMQIWYVEHVIVYRSLLRYNWTSIELFVK
jgi:hypothetical protein